ncbi:MAG: large-conductance mechanosensitive channel protein MscL [Bacteroidales bacterium]|jgi:large conductance mechanosensitive channel|nr:large-conductance mechanosensitive channel protein MscL [Bacteroidales bacterium]
MNLFKEFKDFAMRGNVIDMAVGVIIGSAFGKIVSSLVADIIMPPIGVLLGGVHFSELSFTLKKPVIENGVEIAKSVTLNYGNFAQTTFDFLIISFCIFMFVKGINTLRKKPEPAKPAEPSNEEKLLTEIRDLLKENKK